MNSSGKTSRNRPVDRRVQKTKRLLSEALVALILEKGYAKVSIQDIIDRANVGRSTFYLHYENKEQLLLWGHDHLKKLILEDGDTRIDFLDFYQHIAEREILARSILTMESGQMVTQFLIDILTRSICRLYPASGTKEERSMHAMRAEATAAALVRLMTAWLRNGMPTTPERMALESEACLASLFG
jgi:AcrR family transcriptional regulator